MISYEEALGEVLDNPLELGVEKVSLLESHGRVLAEDILADRDFPPFNRSTKDGIALDFSSYEQGRRDFKITGVLAAGMPQQTLNDKEECLEIMTGAVLPAKADTIVMYEETEIENGIAKILSQPKKGQNIHQKAADIQAGEILLKKGKTISTSAIGVMASVGKSYVLVKRLPKIAVISTGNELVEISETPLAHQIRKSNVISLSAALKSKDIEHQLLHLPDDKLAITKEIKQILAEFDVLMLSGGVSKGKFDYLPEVFEELGIEKVFHKVSQRPGKPFLFGRNSEKTKVVFSFPGNPVSTYANYHVYFLPWLNRSLGIPLPSEKVVVTEEVVPHEFLTLFLQVKISWNENQLQATLVKGNGSGDLVSLALADGFIKVPKGTTTFEPGSQFEYIPAK
ncbi:molybdopterin molybdenumtransferase MoeA [Euzebyella marina]|uniref:Molybdopterin molybdenumtransferase n=1 Tax=Euzebyella marina TaxID=1761453 RepID=A0A3G2L8H2_9FLAO|nr:molybdopterin molybdotransferase MoeA [Euzebyella marina]AYN68493.1 molybdopterin molybdenumtransferase MoeA [Euzebyella marina]